MLLEDQEAIVSLFKEVVIKPQNNRASVKCSNNRHMELAKWTGTKLLI